MFSLQTLYQLLNLAIWNGMSECGRPMTFLSGGGHLSRKQAVFYARQMEEYAHTQLQKIIIYLLIQCTDDYTETAWYLYPSERCIYPLWIDVFCLFWNRAIFRICPVTWTSRAEQRSPNLDVSEWCYFSWTIYTFKYSKDFHRNTLEDTRNVPTGDSVEWNFKFSRPQRFI